MGHLVTSVVFVALDNIFVWLYLIIQFLGIFYSFIQFTFATAF